jgi:large subunit ribosomal protein L9
MEVILKQDVEDLGQKGQVVKVAPGYARNFLFPRELAVQATSGNIRNLQHFMDAAEKKREAERSDAQKTADAITQLPVVIEAKAGEKNRLFGSVTAQDIADVINGGLSLSIDKKKINTAGSIKTLGKHKVLITVYPGLVIEKEIDVKAAAVQPGEETPEPEAPVAAEAAAKEASVEEEVVEETAPSTDESQESDEVESDLKEEEKEEEAPAS